MAHKAAETTHNTNNAFGPGTAKEGTAVVQEGVQSRQEPWGWGAQWPCTESLQRPRQKPLQKLILLQPLEKLSKNSILAFNLQSHSTVSWHLKQIGKVKRLNKWVPYKLTEKSKKNHCSEVSSSFVLLNSELFLHRIVICDKKWILYDSWWWPAQWLDREVPPKPFPKPNLHQIKGHGHCLVVCCKSDLLYLSESQQNHYIWETGSANRWHTLKTTMPAASTGQQKGPNSPW